MMGLILHVEFIPVFLIGNFISNSSMAGIYAMQLANDPQEARQIFMHHRHSLFYGVNPDRYVAAQGLLASRKLIKARA